LISVRHIGNAHQPSWRPVTRRARYGLHMVIPLYSENFFDVGIALDTLK